MRDWASVGEHVNQSLYQPILAALLERVTPTSDCKPKVLVPGAGLCRLSWEIAGAGYEVEANEYSPLFATIAEVLLNRDTEPRPLCPLAHLFSENFSLENQFFECSVPAPRPFGAERKVVMRMGDFVQLYREGGHGHGVYDAVVTCFFLDTCKEIIEYLEIIAGLLAPGGTWINLGPLNYIPASRLKLCWDEIKVLAERLGLHAEFQTEVDTAYSLQAGVKMYAEQYHAVFFVARKAAA